MALREGKIWRSACSQHEDQAGASAAATDDQRQRSRQPCVGIAGRPPAQRHGRLSAAGAITQRQRRRQRGQRSRRRQFCRTAAGVAGALAAAMAAASATAAAAAAGPPGPRPLQVLLRTRLLCQELNFNGAILQSSSMQSAARKRRQLDDDSRLAFAMLRQVLVTANGGSALGRSSQSSKGTPAVD